VIVNGESVNETADGSAASLVVELLSVEVSCEAVYVIFDGTTALVNRQVVAASKEGSTVMIDGEEVSVTFDGSEVIVNGETSSEVVPSAAVAEGGVTSEAVVPESVEVNRESVTVKFDGTVALVNICPVIATDEGYTVEIDKGEVSVTFDGTNVIVNVEFVGVGETVGGGATSAVVESKSVEVKGEAVSVIFYWSTTIVNTIGNALTMST